ncbi:hypothetical protein OAT93_00880 [bacterium]|nr:hypothetical protein [bacterium]
MKKLLLLIIAISFLFGCAGERVRTVQDDNIFYSSSTPKMRIKINPDFKLKEETDEHETGFSLGNGDKSSTTKLSSYLFIDHISGKLRAIGIEIEEIVEHRWEFEPNIFRLKDPFKKGIVKIQGKDYQYCIFAVNTPDGFVLIKGIGKLVGGHGKAMFKIYYYGYVTGDWSNFNMLTSEQNKQLDEFIEDSDKDFTFLDYQAPTSATSNPERSTVSLSNK